MATIPDMTTFALAKRILALALSLACAAVQQIHDAVLLLLFGAPAPSTPVVLTYHAVPDEDAARFAAQMRDLKELAEPVFADDAGEARAGRTAAVTFDDGFQSVFDNALPIMARMGVPATLFVPTGYLDAAPGWIPAVRRQPGSSGIVASAETLASSNPDLVRIGSHTVSHPHLTLQARHAVHAELAESKRTLESITRAPVTMLSFPYGSFDGRVLEAAGAAGYQHLFANVPVWAGTRDRGQLLGRINVSPRDWPLEFRLKARGAYNWMALAVPAKRAIVDFLKSGKRA
jgi:peptidoglycan/xylan/chitin deacetylase (PgdA/CDA1 family)